MKIGIIFPGQGSQYLGMGKEFYDKERIVQELFEEASSCLDINFVKLCFASSESVLRETANAQVTIFLVSASIYSVLNQKYGIVPSLLAGHSSGEYSAVFAGGGMTFPDVLYLLKKRAYFMEEATKEKEGGMIAIIGLEEGVVREICRRYDRPDGDDFVAELVNFNAPQQFVVSGTLPELEKIKRDAKLLNGVVVELKVAGAFHSRLMKAAEKKFSNYLHKVDFKALTIPLVNNVEARIIQAPEDIKDSLVRQMSSNILWWPAMQYFKNMDLIIEIGPGNKLAKILKKEWPEKEVWFVSNPSEMLDLLHRMDIEIKDEFEDEDQPNESDEEE